MGLSNLIIKTTDFLRPVLVKIIPKKLLSGLKQRFLMSNAEKLTHVQLLPFERDRFPVGINLIGNIKGDSGLGQSCRLLAGALDACAYPLCIVEHSISTLLSSTDTAYDNRLEKENRYGVNIFHINPHEFGPAWLQLGRRVWDRHYNIAYWLWELPEFPDGWVNCISLLDEIWTPAEYISQAIRRKTDKPVFTIPYHVTAPADERFDRAYFGLPEDKFLFLMMFDCGSMVERKNPGAVIRAFRLAFGPDADKVRLVIKVNGGTPERISQVEQYTAGQANVLLINKIFTKTEINSLIRCCDVVVSLHRAEGFGLVMAEAMLNNVPCIATNWSANTEFMNPEVACMVDVRVVELTEDIGPYKKGSHWADPDAEQAAAYMRKLYDEPEYRSALAERAGVYIREKLSLEKAVSLINERMKAIYGQDAAPAAPGTEEQGKRESA